MSRALAGSFTDIVNARPRRSCGSWTGTGLATYYFWTLLNTDERCRFSDSFSAKMVHSGWAPGRIMTTDKQVSIVKAVGRYSLIESEIS